MSGTVKRALIVVDVQNDYAHGNLPIAYPDVDASLDRIARAIDAANAHAIPVVAIQNIAAANAPFMVEGSRGAELHEVVATRGRSHIIRKNLPSAFAGTDLDAWLRQHGVDTITVAGYMTHNCNLSTIIDGFHRGFNVEFLSDASGSVPYLNQAGQASAEEIHRVVSVVLQSRFAAVLATEDWIAALESKTPPVRDSIYLSNQRARGLIPSV
jgi:nicotinamidase-related amidase